MSNNPETTRNKSGRKNKKEVNPGQPGSLRRINIDRIVRKIQTDAPITRSDLVRSTGLSYPTVMKIADFLLEKNMVEWDLDESNETGGRGRPASYMQMASNSAHVIAVSFRPTLIHAAISSLDGKIIKEIECPIPSTYPEILEASVQLIKDLQRSSNSPTLGVGLASPGLLEIGNHSKLTISANIPALTEHFIAEDLAELIHLPTVIVGTMRSLYNSEIIRGHAVDHKNFAILNYYAGMGLAVSSNGNYIDGAHGMAGELGHIVVEVGGELCGCGNRGCLETRATDHALAKSISKRMERTISVDEMSELIRKSPSRFEDEIDQMLNFLAISIGMTINIFNPETVLLYGRLLDIHPSFFDKLQKKVPATCLSSLAATCTLKKSNSRTIEGAALAIVEELTNKLGSKS